MGCRVGEAETSEPAEVVEVDEAVWVPQAVKERKPTAATKRGAVKRVDGIGESLPYAHMERMSMYTYALSTGQNEQE